MEGKIILGYWNNHGRGHIFRQLLSYTGMEWDDRVYNTAEEWFSKDKTGLGLDFPDLPYIKRG